MTATSDSTGLGPTHEDVRFSSGVERCAAWLFRPADTDTDGDTDGDTDAGVSAPGPIVVMAHGFSGVRGMRLDAYAERFAAAGYRVLVFDYRHFGDSEGTPRNLLSISRRHADWRAAVDYARTLPDADPARVVLWGTSLSGGDVLHIAARDPRIAAVIAQVPHVSGISAVGAVGPVMSARLAARGVADLARAVLKREPLYVDAVGEPGTLAAMTAPGARSGHDEIVAQSAGVQPTEQVAARILLRMPFYSPGRNARRIHCPVLVQIADHDQITPPTVAERTARRIRRATVRRYPMTHFEPYVAPGFDRIVTDQLGFLRDVAPAT